jgi:CBS domain containing-hemolysin-like protein
MEAPSDGDAEQREHATSEQSAEPAKQHRVLPLRCRLKLCHLRARHRLKPALLYIAALTTLGCIMALADGCGVPQVLDNATIMWCGRRWVQDIAVSASFGEEPIPAGTQEFYINLGISVVLITVAGVMAGLTMGTVSMESTYLHILQATGTPAQRRQAKSLSFFVSRHHLTLVTLLLANAAANEMLPIFLDQIVDPATAVLISVTAVLIFGEIIPSAICTGPAQLRVAAALTPLLWVFVVALFPIAYPISRFLDCCLGEDHGTRYRRDELKEFIRLHGSVRHAANRFRDNAKHSHDADTGDGLLSKSDSKQPLLPSAGSGAGSAASAAYGSAVDDVAFSVRHSASFKAHGSGLASSDQQVRAAVSTVGARAASVVDSADMAGMLVIAKSTSKRAHGKRSHAAKGSSSLRVVPEQALIDSDGSDDEGEGGSEQFVESHALLTDEVKMLEGVLELHKQSIDTVMTPIERVFALDTTAKMDRATMVRVLESGFSRVPVHAPGDSDAYTGFILVKMLIRLDPEDAVPVSSLRLLPALAIHPRVSLFDALNAFQTGRAHLAFVTEQDEELAACLEAGSVPPSHVQVQGLVTIEDVLEAIIKEDIEDEADLLRSTGRLKNYVRAGAAAAGAAGGAAAAADGHHSASSRV